MNIRLLFQTIMLLIAIPLVAEPRAFFTLSRFTFSRPASWRWLNQADKRPSAFLIVPDNESSVTAKITMIHYLPTEGLGTRPAALKRWTDLFADTPERISSTNDLVVAGHSVTYFHIKGTYLAGKSGAESKPDYALLGVIIKDNEGNVLGKMEGPEKLVEKSNDEFRKMIESALTE